MMKLFTIIITFAISFPCSAATTTWESFDLNNCHHWMMSPDGYGKGGANLEKANKLAEEMNSKDRNNRWLVVGGGTLFEKGEDLYGVCSFQSSWSIVTCVNGINFPLSGATYKQIGTQMTLDTYKCMQGCDATEVQMIHDMGYENSPEDINVEYEKMKAKFENKCHEKERKEQFFKEYLKRE